MRRLSVIRGNGNEVFYVDSAVGILFDGGNGWDTADLLIDGGDGNSITLLNVDRSELDRSDFFSCCGVDAR